MEDRSRGSIGFLGLEGSIPAISYMFESLSFRLLMLAQDVILKRSGIVSEDDAFVFPTFYDLFVNACREAIASELPCVLSSQNGGTEIISDRKEGYVLDDPTNTDEISRLISLCMDEEQMTAMWSAARALALKFTWEANVDATENLYREVVKDMEAGS